MYLKLVRNVQLHCLVVGQNADDWTVVSTSELNDISVAACAGKTCLRI